MLVVRVVPADAISRAALRFDGDRQSSKRTAPVLRREVWMTSGQLIGKSGCFYPNSRRIDGCRSHFNTATGQRGYH